MKEDEVRRDIAVKPDTLGRSRETGFDEATVE
jgi:hypothetical protein